MNDHSSVTGLLALAGGVLLYFVLRRLFPSLATAMLVIGGVLLLLIIALVVLVIVVSRRGKGQKNGADAVLSACRAHILEIRRANMRIRDEKIRAASAEILPIAEDILRVLKEKPQRILSLRSFHNYYLPTYRKILCKYAYLEGSRAATDETAEAVLRCLGEIRCAMQKQYENLFAEDELDLHVEMEVLSRICKRDGLLDEEDFPQENGGGSV